MGAKIHIFLIQLLFGCLIGNVKCKGLSQESDLVVWPFNSLSTIFQRFNAILFSTHLFHFAIIFVIINHNGLCTKIMFIAL